MNIIFMGTPDFALPSLKALQTSEHKIVAVYTQPPRPAGRGQKERPSAVHLFANEHNIPVFTPKTFKDDVALKELQSHNADIAVVVAYGMLLPKSVLESFDKGCINVHPSALPRWRGAAPLQRTIMAGDTHTKVMIMQMDEELDTGDILSHVDYDIHAGCTAGELHDTLSELAGPLLSDTVNAIARGTAKATPQSEQGVTYAKKILKPECHIDWNKPVKEIYHHINGLSPTPGATANYGDITLKIYAAEYDSAAAHHTPGTVLNEKCSIACSDGNIVPTIMQWPAKRRLSAQEMLRGNPIPIGTVLT